MFTKYTDVHSAVICACARESDAMPYEFTLMHRAVLNWERLFQL